MKEMLLSWASAGGLGFRGSRKSTPYAAQMAAETATKAALVHGLKDCRCIWLKDLVQEEKQQSVHFRHVVLKLQALQDVTPVPHNGCRPPKRRRV